MSAGGARWLERRHRILIGRRVRMLGAEPVVDRNDLERAGIRDLRTNIIMALQPPNDEAAAMQI